MSTLFAELARPAQPDREFRDSLFESLLAEIDFESGRPRGASPPSRPRHSAPRHRHGSNHETKEWRTGS